MAKLYVFGIGGTGSRVIKALTYMLASGVELGSDIDIVVPIIIDPDNSNGDYTRTVQLLNLYNDINKVAKNEDGFFSMPIKTLTELTGDNIINIQDKFKMLHVATAQNETFRHFIGYGDLDNSNRSLIDLLFSENNLKADMTVGFKGNPNIGSIVLNQFKKSPEYQVFLNSFSEGDSIFIVSSIFGGTGAAGFPLLLRNLREVDADFPGSNVVANSRIGALSMMPYFKIRSPHDDKEQTIDSSSFMGKAKAALDFYSQSIFRSNNQLNAFYTLGEDSGHFQEHNDGQAVQKNDAHFLELSAALAIVDFTNSLNAMSTTNTKASQTLFKEFGIEDAKTRKITMKDLGLTTRKQILKPLSKFALMVRFSQIVSSNSSDYEKSPWFEHLSKCFANDGFYNLFLKNIESGFVDWLKEMEKSDIHFDPFELEISYSNLLNFINDFKLKNKIWQPNNSHGKKLEKALNSEKKSLKKNEELGSDYIEMFNNATSTVVEQIVSI